jgi:antitoxin HicB
MLIYPVNLTQDDNDTWLVDFPDFPEAHTFGDTPDEALERAKDALATVIDAYVADRRPIPAPPAVVREPRVELPALVSAKVDLYCLLRAQHLRKTDLARRLNWHLPQVDRLLDMHHISHLDQLEAAARVFGKRLVVAFEDLQPARMLKARLRARVGRNPKLKRKAIASGIRTRRSSKR